MLAVILICREGRAVDLEKLRLDVDASSARVVGYEEQISQMEGRYVKTLTTDKASMFDNRYNNAALLYKAGDFVHSSIIFSDLLTYPNVKAKTQYYSMLFYLGSSLYHSGNYISARQYLEEVVNVGETGRYFRDAALTMIDIHVRQDRFNEAERFYKLISRVSGAEGWDSIQYAYGKLLHREKKLDLSLRTMDQIPVSSEYYPRAQYFKGVILIEKKDLKQALEIFERLRTIEVQTVKDRRLNDLSTLAVARIKYDLGLFDEALSIYRLIPVDSPFFDQAYHEICWIYVKKAKKEEAANTLDILLIARPDSMYEPELRLLKGDIALWALKYSVAENSFMHVADKYHPVVMRMDEILKTARGMGAEAIERNLMGKDASLPPIVRLWLSQEELVSDSLLVNEELSESGIDLNESQKIIDTLTLHLNQKNKANLFPQLKEGRDTGMQLKTELTRESATLASLAAELLGEYAPDQQSKLEEIRNKRLELEKNYEQIPRTAEGRQERRQRHVERMRQVDQEIYKLQLQLEGLNEIVAEIGRRQEMMRGDPTMSQDYLQRVTERIGGEQQEMKAMIGELDGLAKEVKTETEMAMIGEESDQRDVAIMKQIKELTRQEEELVASLGAGFSDEGRLLLQQIEDNRKRTDATDDKIEKYFAALESLVSGAVAEYSKALENEKLLMKAYLNEVDRFQRESQLLSGLIAYDNLRAVRNRFYDYVLKADMGAVNIAWEKRQEVRGKIDELLDMRAKDLEALEEGFRAIREGSL